MKHYVYLIGSKDGEYLDIVGLYDTRKPTRYIHTIVSEGEEYVLVSETKLTMVENFQRFFWALSIISQSLRGVSTRRREMIGVYFKSHDYSINEIDEKISISEAAFIQKVRELEKADGKIRVQSDNG